MRTVVSENLGRHALGAGALAKYGHLLRIPAEGGNVLIHPTKSEALVTEADICSAGVENLLATKEAEGGQSVVDTDPEYG
jgi:hypothetical protein